MTGGIYFREMWNTVFDGNPAVEKMRLA